MIEFPTVPAIAGLKVPKMGLRDYARFSEWCLRSNPAITPGNCMVKRAAEKMIKAPFRLESGSPCGPEESRVGRKAIAYHFSGACR